MTGALVTASRRTGAPAGPRWRTRNPSTAVAFRFLVAPVVLLLALTIYPLIFAVWTSLSSYWLFAPERATFVGLDNYIALFQMPLFGGTVLRTLAYAGG